MRRSFKFDRYQRDIRLENGSLCPVLFDLNDAGSQTRICTLFHIDASHQNTFLGGFEKSHQKKFNFILTDAVQSIDQDKVGFQDFLGKTVFYP